MEVPQAIHVYDAQSHVIDAMEIRHRVPTSDLKGPVHLDCSVEQQDRAGDSGTRILEDLDRAGPERLLRCCAP